MAKQDFMKKFIIGLTFLAIGSTQGNDIILSKGINARLREKLEIDMQVLDNLKFKSNTNKATLDLLNISTLNTQSAVDWLGQRVNYVIEENALSIIKLIIKKSIYVERENVQYPNADIHPFSSTESSSNFVETTKEDDGVTVMSNIGSGLYMAGKKEQKLYGIKISRGLLKKGIKVSIESPRSGIIQIGEGLFLREISINNENPEAISNSLNRLGTFFHEARHSDGNGLSLGFAHSICPTGHDLAGAYACDEGLNGAYAVGATMLKEMLSGCEEACSEREKETIRAVILDSKSRILTTTLKGNPATNWDPTPESL